MTSHHKSTTDVTVIGIDIGKNTFHLIGQNRNGKIVMRARLSRSQLMVRLVNVPRCLIGMEAGADAHHVARCLLEFGHDVRRIPAQYVKPFLKGHKNDYRDAHYSSCVGCKIRPTIGHRHVGAQTANRLALFAEG